MITRARNKSMITPTAHERESMTTAGASDSPAQHPIVFFDGVCGLCNTSVDFLIARDRRRVLRYAPLQGETAAARLDPRDIESLKSIVLADCDGVHRQSTAIVRTLRHLGGGWKLAGWLLWVIPRPLRNIGYRFVSANRYRLFGKKDACRMPTPEERALFLP
jgi:predicted DCC family thiol-disulfide oxidoreductase YuxK